jgi:NADH-quinone oxidoreductase subunit M
MVAHGLLAALTFALSAHVQRETGTLEIKDLGGLWQRMPFIGAAMMMAMMAGCGLPGFANFPGELLTMFGAWNMLPMPVVLAAWGALVIGAVYMLRALRNVMHGPLPPKWGTVNDAASLWQKTPFALLLTALLVFGFYPGLLTRQIEPSVKEMVRTAGYDAPAKPAPQPGQRIRSLLSPGRKAAAPAPK